MSEVLPLALYRRKARPPAVGPGDRAHRVFFERSEFNRILSLYSRRVIDGEWCDYAIESGRDVAVFAIYRRACEVPAYRIVKRERARLRSSGYLVTGGGRVLGYGGSLESVLAVFERRRPRLVDLA